MIKATISTYASGEKYISGLLPSQIRIVGVPGHGTRQYTDGKCAPDKSYFEGEWARIMVPKILTAFEEMGFKTTNLIPGPEDVNIHTRAAMANKLMAEHPDEYLVYLAIHSNAVNEDSEPAKSHGGWDEKACGFVVYAARDASTESEILARNVYDAAYAMGRRGNRSIPAERFWRANWVEIHETKMPAILTESDFHTNHKSIEYLMSEKGQDELVSIHVAGVCKTFGIPYSICKG